MQAFCRFFSESKKFFLKLFKPSSRHYTTNPLLDMGVDFVHGNVYTINCQEDITPTTAQRHRLTRGTENGLWK